MSNYNFYYSNPGSFLIAYSSNSTNIERVFIEPREEPMARFIADKDEQGYSKLPIEAITFEKVNQLVSENEYYKKEFSRLSDELYIIRKVLLTVLPRGLPVRCGRCKQKWYTLHIPDWLLNSVLCPNCGAKTSLAVSVVPSDDNQSVLNRLANYALVFAKSYEADAEYRAERNVTLEEKYKELHSFLNEAGFTRLD